LQASSRVDLGDVTSQFMGTIDDSANVPLRCNVATAFVLYFAILSDDSFALIQQPFWQILQFND
jgi:hypothetical protein